MASGTFVKFEASHHAAVGLLGLNTILVLPLARVPLLKLKSKVPELFFQAVLVIWPIWAQITKTQAAAQELQLWDSHQLAESKNGATERRCSAKKVKLRSCR